MEIKDVLEKPLIVRPEDTVGGVASRMIENNRHEAVVLGKSGELLGIVLARDLVKKKVSDPHKAKISQFMIEERPILPGMEAEELINAFLVNDYRSVPVKSEGGIMVLTKMDLLSLVKGSPEIKGKKAEDVMKFPHCISMGDSISSVRAIMKGMNVSRIPVVRNGKVEGMIDTLDMLKPIVRGEVSKRGEPDEERTHLEASPASNLMRKGFPTAEPTAPLASVIDMIVESRSAAIIERDGKLAGIVTPGDILKLFGKEVKGAYVAISGIEDEDDFAKNAVYAEIEFTLKKINRIYPVNYFVAHLDKYNTSGKRAKYSFRGRLATGKGFFFAQHHDWDIRIAIKGLLDRLEKEVSRKKERLVF